MRRSEAARHPLPQNTARRHACGQSVSATLGVKKNVTKKKHEAGALLPKNAKNTFLTDAPTASASVSLLQAVNNRDCN